MGNNLFGADIAGKIAKAFKRKLLTGTLRSKTPGTRTAGSLTAGTNPSTKRATFEGFLDTYKESEVDGTTVQKGDRKLFIIGDTLPTGRVPSANDEAVIEGSTFRLTGLAERDPDAATYVINARPVTNA